MYSPPILLLVTLQLTLGAIRVREDDPRSGFLQRDRFKFANQNTNTLAAWQRAAVNAHAQQNDFSDLPRTALDWEAPRLDNRQLLGDGLPSGYRGRGCDKRIRIINGATRIRDRGTLARFQCSYGFHMLGASVAVCVSGKWSDSPPICVRDGCGKLPIPIHGTLRLLYGGGVGIFTCNYGFQIEGERVLTCDGMRWNGTAPNCIEMPPVELTTPTPTATPSTFALPTPVWGPDEPSVTASVDPVTEQIPIVPETENSKTNSDEIENNSEAESTTFNTVEPDLTSQAVDEVVTTTELSEPEVTTPTSNVIEQITVTLTSVDTTTGMQFTVASSPASTSLEKHEPDATTDTANMEDIHDLDETTVTETFVTPTFETESPQKFPQPPTSNCENAYGTSCISDPNISEIPIISDESLVVTAVYNDANEQTSASSTAENTAALPAPTEETKPDATTQESIDNDIVTAGYSTESDIVTVPEQPDAPVTTIYEDDTTEIPSTLAPTRKEATVRTTPSNTAQTQMKQDFDFTHEKIREYVALTPSKLDVVEASHHLAMGHLLVIAGTALITIGFVFVIAGTIMYCWRRNKGIARPRRSDTDGRTLSFHEGVDELVWIERDNTRF